MGKISSKTRSERAEQLCEMIMKEPEKFVERFFDMEEMIFALAHEVKELLRSNSQR